ncbi:unnamed protein product, partial [Ectocarpus sp. 12 AP-2014]
GSKIERRGGHRKPSGDEKKEPTSTRIKRRVHREAITLFPHDDVFGRGILLRLWQHRYEYPRPLGDIELLQGTTQFP